MQGSLQPPVWVYWNNELFGGSNWSEIVLKNSPGIDAVYLKLTRKAETVRIYPFIDRFSPLSSRVSHCASYVSSAFWAISIFCYRPNCDMHHRIFNVHIYMSFYICLNLFACVYTRGTRFTVSPEGLKGTSLLRFGEKTIFCIQFSYFSHFLSVNLFFICRLVLPPPPSF